MSKEIYGQMCIQIIFFICLSGLLENGRAANVGEACPNGNTDCVIESSVCTDGNCICDSTHFKNSSTVCTLKKNLKESCADGIPNQCMIPNTDCIEASTTGTFQCLCKATHFENNGACTEKINLKTACTKDKEDQCKTNNADCLKTSVQNIYQCQCKSMYYENSGECNDKKAYDENCTAAEQCMGDNVDCTADTKKCACKAEFFADSNNNYTCTQKKAYDENCTSAVECTGVNVDCPTDTNKCACKADFYADTNKNNICTQKKSFDETCTTAVECKGENVVCIADTKKCACKADFFADTANNNICTPKKAYGENCTAAEECRGENVVCTDGTKKCACKTDFFADTNNNKVCTQKIALNENCSIGPNDQCSTENAECKMDSSSTTKCLCSAYFYENSGACVEKKKLGDSCSKGQCNDTNAECSTTAQCTCKDTFYDKSSVCTQMDLFSKSYRGNQGSSGNQKNVIHRQTASQGFIPGRKEGGYNGSCTTAVTESCLYSLTCTNDKCVCGNASLFFESTTNNCKQKIALNGGCNTKDQKQCVDPLAVCKTHGSDAKCLCNDASYDNSGSCSARIKHDNICTESGHVNQCVENAMCTENGSEFKCKCKNGNNMDGTCNGGLMLVGSLFCVASVFFFSKLLS